MSKNTLIVVASPDRVVCNDPEALEIAFHHQGPTFINAIVRLLQTWFIETEGNMGIIICLSQGGLRCMSALSSSILFWYVLNL